VPDSVAVRSGQFVKVQLLAHRSGAPGAFGVGHDLARWSGLCRRHRQPRGAPIGHDRSPRGNQVEILSGSMTGPVILAQPAGMQEGQLLEIQP